MFLHTSQFALFYRQTRTFPFVQKKYAYFHEIHYLEYIDIKSTLFMILNIYDIQPNFNLHSHTGSKVCTQAQFSITMSGDCLWFGWLLNQCAAQPMFCLCCKQISEVQHICCISDKVWLLLLPFNKCLILSRSLRPVSIYKVGNICSWVCPEFEYLENCSYDLLYTWLVYCWGPNGVQCRIWCNVTRRWHYNSELYVLACNLLTLSRWKILVFLDSVGPDESIHESHTHLHLDWFSSILNCI